MGDGGVGGERGLKGKGKRAKRSANQWQLMGGLPRVVWEVSMQSAAHESHCVGLAHTRTCTEGFAVQILCYFSRIFTNIFYFVINISDN